ncbi:MAG: thiol peroxidase [Desulfuromonadales bacterium]|nr:thiol peroxidase [Desulfuromonadales bacterium]
MTTKMIHIVIAAFFVTGLNGCALHSLPEIPTSTETVAAGSTVTRAGNAQNLIGDGVAVGQTLPNLKLTDRNMQLRSLDELRGRTVLLSISPSLDTQVCERQTHLLGEADVKDLPEEVVRVKITRDLPFAQSRFATETGFENIFYLSDYKSAEFGRGTGLLLEDLGLLARAVMVVDSEGTIRYLQVVPEVSHLPDMEKAFAVAREIATEE